MSCTPYQSEETLTASRNIPWAGEERGQSATSKDTGLLIAGEVERKEADLEEVVVGLRPWGGEGDRWKGRWWGSSEDLAEFHLRPHFWNEVNDSYLVTTFC